MKNVLLLFCVLCLCDSADGQSKSYQKEDSLLIVWMKDFSETSKLPCEQIRLKEFDTMGKVMVSRDVKFLSLSGFPISLNDIEPCQYVRDRPKLPSLDFSPTK